MTEQENKNEGQPIVVSSQNVINTDPNLVDQTIEVKASQAENENKPKPFLTKKKVIIACIFFLVSIGFVVITVRPILKIDWKQLFDSMYQSFQPTWQCLGYVWLLTMILNSIVNVLRCFITLTPRLRKMGYKISFGECMLFGITVCFLGQVTPANLIIDPYTIFWMKTHGVPTSKCASILFSNALFWQVSTIIINIPIFIICALKRDLLTINPEGSFCFTMIVVGFVLDYICLLFLYFMNTSRRFHYRCSVIFNWFKKKFHMKYHTKPEIVEKYKTNAVIKQDFYSYLKDWKTSLLIFGLFGLGEIWAIACLPFSMYFVQLAPIYPTMEGSEIVKVGFSFGWVFICGKLSSIANRINLLPGAAMGYEAALKTLIYAFAGWSPIKVGGVPLPETDPAVSAVRSRVTSNGILIAKFFGSYIPATFGIGGFIALTVSQARAKKA